LRRNAAIAAGVAYTLNAIDADLLPMP